jgi:regulatory protein
MAGMEGAMTSPFHETGGAEESGAGKADEADAVSEPRPDTKAATPARRRKRPEPTPTQRALGLLVRREHSQRELTRKLRARGIDGEEATAAVEKLKAAGWQDDARFAENLVRSRAVAGFGPLRIRAELGTHGLEREAVTTAMEGFDGDWNEIARDLVKRRFGAAGAQDRAQQRKAAELLIRRGFGGDQIRAATRFDPDE